MIYSVWHIAVENFSRMFESFASARASNIQASKRSIREVNKMKAQNWTTGRARRLVWLETAEPDTETLQGMVTLESRLSMQLDCLLELIASASKQGDTSKGCKEAQRMVAGVTRMLCRNALEFWPAMVYQTMALSRTVPSKPCDMLVLTMSESERLEKLAKYQLMAEIECERRYREIAANPQPVTAS